MSSAYPLRKVDAIEGLKADVRREEVARGSDCCESVRGVLARVMKALRRHVLRSWQNLRSGASLMTA